MHAHFYMRQTLGCWLMPDFARKCPKPIAIKADFQIHLHTNGDKAMALVLDNIEKLLQGGKSEVNPYKNVSKWCFHF